MLTSLIVDLKKTHWAAGSRQHTSTTQQVPLPPTFEDAPVSSWDLLCFPFWLIPSKRYSATHCITLYYFLGSNE